MRLIGGGCLRQQQAIETVEMHTGGEPLRIVVGGYPEIPGVTLLEKRRYARERLDYLRRMLIFEPRGHADMYGAILVAPDRLEADLGVLFIHNEGYSTMCGHAVIALGRYAVDAGLVEAKVPETKVVIQCPCGLVTVRVQVTENPSGYETGAAAFLSVPSFAFALDLPLEVPGSVTVACDIGYGGAFYAVLPAATLGFDFETAPLAELVNAADRVTKAARSQVSLEHPESPDLAFLYGTILTDGRTGADGKPSRNLCVFAEREVDRSPTGSGVSARMAIQVARGQTSPGETCRFKSITDAVFSAQVRCCEKVGPHDSVRVEVAGRAFYSGRSSFSVEAADDLGCGFLLA